MTVPVVALAVTACGSSHPSAAPRTHSAAPAASMTRCAPPDDCGTPTSTPAATDPNGQACDSLDSLGYCPVLLSRFVTVDKPASRAEQELFLSVATSLPKVRAPDLRRRREDNEPEL
jgi:hypothetical protein